MEADPDFVAAALKELAFIDRISTYTSASAASGLINHWLVERDLACYSRGRPVEDVAALTVYEVDGSFDTSMAALEDSLLIDRQELVELLRSRGISVPLALCTEDVPEDHSGEPKQFVLQGINSTTTLSAASYKDYQREQDARRAEGRYNLEEAALTLATRASERAAPMLDKLMAAVRTGALPVYEPGLKARYLPNTVREFYEEAYWHDLNAWLNATEPMITWRFPMPKAVAEDLAFDALLSERETNGTEIDWDLWIRMPALTPAQAARLISGLDPQVFASLDARPTRMDPSERCKQAQEIEAIANDYRQKPLPPSEWLRWAEQHSMNVHAGFRVAVHALQISQPKTLRIRTPAERKATPCIGVGRKEILAIDWPLIMPFTQASLDAALSDVPQWLLSARVAKGAPGKGSALWNPALVAACLLEKGHARAAALTNIIRKNFPDFLEQWEPFQDNR